MAESNWYTAKICLNGHVLTRSLDMNPDVGDYCKICGSKAIDCCPKCSTRILGGQRGASWIFEMPEFCQGCGEPYPWAGKIAKGAETPQTKWIRWTSPFYWFLVTKRKTLVGFTRLRKHHWTTLEILTTVLIVIGIVTVITILAT